MTEVSSPPLMLALALVALAGSVAHAQPCADSARVVSDSARPWVYVVEHLACERTRLADDLAGIHTRLKARAAVEAPSLLARIRPAPPKPRPTGYALLPEFTADVAEATVPLTESRFSLESLVKASDSERRAASELALQVGMDSASLEPMVKSFERLKRQLAWLESSISYHRFWQKSADGSRAYFAGRNLLVERARALRQLQQQHADSAGAFQRALASAVAPFASTPGLVWRRDPDGMRVFPIEVITDITDTLFLGRFASAVQWIWNESAPARERKFRVALKIVRRTPATLYPQGIPVVGSPVNETAHVARFPKGALVLTTGGGSTHATVNRYVQLGTAPVSARVLAHEFGHLLGFSDGYLRGTEGAGSDPFGLVFVEWTGILDDLMGSPGVGKLTMDMVDRLIAAYAPRGGGNE